MSVVTLLQHRRRADLQSRRRATRLALHVSNALIELEAIERQPRTRAQDDATADVRRSLLELRTRVQTLHAAFPGEGTLAPIPDQSA